MSLDRRATSRFRRVAAPGRSCRVPARPVVVLLHGLARTRFSLSGLARHLERAGFTTWSRTYPSRHARRSPRRPTRSPTRSRASCPLGRPLAAVTHSLGGILLRHVAQRIPFSRVVMLAPPNQGSRLSRALRDRPVYRWFFGRAGQELAAAAEPGPWPALPPSTAVIAGTGAKRSWNPTGWVEPPRARLRARRAQRRHARRRRDPDRRHGGVRHRRRQPQLDHVSRGGARAGGALSRHRDARISSSRSRAAGRDAPGDALRAGEDRHEAVGDLHRRIARDPGKQPAVRRTAWRRVPVASKAAYSRWRRRTGSGVMTALPAFTYESSTLQSGVDEGRARVGVDQVRGQAGRSQELDELTGNLRHRRREAGSADRLQQTVVTEPRDPLLDPDRRIGVLRRRLIQECTTLWSPSASGMTL